MIQSKLYLLLARSRPGSTSFVAMNEVDAGRDRATPDDGGDFRSAVLQEEEEEWREKGRGESTGQSTI